MGRRIGALSVLWVVLAATSSGASSATILPGFRSPSGNIRCLLVPVGRTSSTLLCQIAEAAYARALVAHCAAPPIGVDWGGFELGATRKGSIVCTGGVLYSPDTQRPRYVTLAYGSRWQRGVFTCWSRRTGVTCRSRAGHGLFVSRESWRAW